MPQTIAFVLLVKNLRVILMPLSTASLLILTSSAEIGGSLIVCWGEPIPFFILFLVFCDIFHDIFTTHTNEWFGFLI